MSLWIDKKYIAILSTQLRNFKWKGQDQAVCSCPVCGDSKVDTRKARGYFFTKSDHNGQHFTYYCHNCQFASGVQRLLDDHFPHYASEYRLEILKERGFTYKKAEPEIVIAAQPKLARLQNLSCVTKLTDLSEKHPARHYVKSRLIPEDKYDKFYWTDDFQSTVHSFAPDKYKLRKESRLCLLLRDRQNNVTGIVGRSLEVSDPRFRYLTLKFDDSSMKLYGLESHQKSKITFVLEGGIDSLFLPNAIALCGSAVAPDLLKTEVDLSKTIICLDNEPRNKEIVAKLYDYVAAGFYVCVWNGMSTRTKDINQMIMAGMSKEHIVKTISRNTHSGLMAVANINRWKRI